MADTSTSVQALLIEVLFVDGDTRTISVRNPHDPDDYSSEDFSDFSNWLATNQVIIGDRNGAAFSKIKQSKWRSTTTINYDLG